MQHRPLGRTGLQLSAVGFGGIPIQLNTREDATAVLKRAVECGVTYFDTARGYGDSEAKFGQALCDENVIIGSKSPQRAADGIVQDIEDSLRRLRRDRIHLYHLHQVFRHEELDRVMGPRGALAALVKAKEQGKIGHIAISGHNRQILLRAVREAGEYLGAVQTLFNPLETDAFDELLPLCHARGIGVIAMKPPGGGVFPHPEVCIKWVLTHDAVSCANVGMSRIAEVEANAAAGATAGPLSDKDKRAVERLRADFDRVYCRRCGLCQPCPKGIDIVGILIGDSMILRMGDGLYYDRGLQEKVARVAECHDCAVCLPRCPFGLDIPELLARAAVRIREMVGEV